MPSSSAPTTNPAGSPAPSSPRALLHLLRPYDPERPTCHLVGPRVGIPANDGPDLIASIRESAPTSPTQLALIAAD